MVFTDSFGREKKKKKEKKSRVSGSQIGGFLIYLWTLRFYILIGAIVLVVLFIYALQRFCVEFDLVVQCMILMGIGINLIC